jgi:hypothetical protein
MINISVETGWTPTCWSVQYHVFCWVIVKVLQENALTIGKWLKTIQRIMTSVSDELLVEFT